ncbi:hypothetical protein ACX93W_03830 [Paenibacillus sp. CAU 1782]
MNAIGHPEIVPLVTAADRFFVTVSSNPNDPERDLGIGQVAFRFTLNVPGKNGERQLSYEANNTSDNNELAIIYIGEIKYEGLPNEIRHPRIGHQLTDLFSSVRDFPAKAYRERTQYGAEQADMYQIRFNDGLLMAESLSYDRNGPVNVNNNSGIPFVITNMQWGEVVNESLDVDNPRRYHGMGGQNGVNLQYYPVLHMNGNH